MTDINDINEDVNAPLTEQKWYVVHTYAGYENRVMANLQKRVESMGMQDKIFQVLVPMEKEIVSKGGQRKTVMKKIFPGYVLVEMIVEDDSWYVVRNTPGVTGFVGSGTQPIPLTEDEINGILKQVGLAEGKPRIDLEIDQLVRVVDGPFKNFEGTIEEINIEKGKLKVMVSMFGREVPVELEFHQVERL
ncbi:MAG: transcription termination/antitermination protein NusG [Firmicutes bacterium]|nr:transcription termination/antitermination protein NusG [Bacillota bacterium]